MAERRKANIDGDVEQITKSMADGIKSSSIRALSLVVGG
jgi:hypothetical protein